MISIPLWLSAAYPCPYLNAQTAHSALLADEVRLTPSLYNELLQYGFRRSGNQVYKPHCPSCQACLPCRVKVADFRADRNQKRCLQRNQNTQSLIKPIRFDQQQADLYQRYSRVRHNDQDTAQDSSDYLDFFQSEWCKTWAVEFYIRNRLAAVAIVDVMPQSLSAVYTFFDPEHAYYSLGTYAVLWQIEQAKLLNLEYVYLGYWIQDCRKMQYKNRFKPLQILHHQHWQEFPF